FLWRASVCPPNVVSSSCTPSSPTEIYPLSLHDALPICRLLRARAPDRALLSRPIHQRHALYRPRCDQPSQSPVPRRAFRAAINRSEEHTSELQSQSNLVCRLLLEKKKKQQTRHKLYFIP